MGFKEYNIKKDNLIKEFLKKKQEGVIALKKDTSNLFRNRKEINKSKIDVRHFNKVISIDQKNLSADVQGFTTYQDLVNETLKYNLMPTVVPQLKTITIGGAYSGGGIESSSFKFGFVHETILEIEVLLSNGETIVCNKEKNQDLFYAFPNSYGTLGYVLRLKVKLIPVKKYVHLEYIKSNPLDLFEKLNLIIKTEKIDFIDAVVFSKDESYIVKARFIDKAPYKSNYTYMNVFYKSLRNRKEDYLTIHDYLWRWDTDWFWCSKAFGVQNKFFRLFWTKKFLNSKTYHKIMRLNAKYKLMDKIPFKKKQITESVIQDVEIPLQNSKKFLKFFLDNIPILPIWICPTKPYNNKVNFDLYKTIPNTLYFNFGFWDVIPSNKEEGFHNKLIEKEVIALKGKKSLYSSSYFKEKDFWNIYNGKRYFPLKKKFDKDNSFLNLYEKCVLRK